MEGGGGVEGGGGHGSSGTWSLSEVILLYFPTI